MAQAFIIDAGIGWFAACGDIQTTSSETLNSLYKGNFIVKHYSFIFILILLLSSFSISYAADFTVSTEAELVTAITTANANAEDDTITLTGNITLTSALPGITADGGNALTLNGNGFTLARSGAAGNFRILTVVLGATVTLNDITISNGNFTTGNAGGILNRGTLTLNNTTISGNRARDDGGGIYSSGILTLNNTTVSGNTAADDEGGGVYNTGAGTVTLNNSTVSDNNSDRDGGGILNNGTMILKNSIVSDNMTLGNNGGGISNEGSLTLNNSIVSGNDGPFLGGGIYSMVGTLTLNNSTVSGNEAGTGGGIHNEILSTLTLNNSIISGNEADYGGGIVNWWTATLNNSTISDNTALYGDGGGIYDIHGTTTLNNSTVSGNTASNDGGGIHTDDGTITLNNSIIAGNTATVGDECFIDTGTGVINTDSNNLLGIDGTGGGCPVGASDLSPNTALANILLPLADNGGPTQTHALVLNSPAIDGSSGGFASDQRGAAANGTRDIGAYEYLGLVPTVTVGTVSASNIDENGGVATITVTVANLAAGDSLEIVANIVGGSATQTVDYTITSSLTFNADSSQSFTITGLADAIADSGETLTVNFSLIGAADITGNGNQTVTIVEATPPVFSKAFAPNPVTLGGISTLTFTIDNTANPVDVTNLDFTDTLPAGMIVATPSNAATTCTGGTLTAVDASGTISYTGGTVAASSSCIIAVDVEGISLGTHTNLSGDLTSSAGNSGTATADLTVNDIPPSDTTPAQNTTSDTAISIFDPTISKLGFLVPGEVGVTGELLEWIVTVSNPSNVAGQNVVITDDIDPRLQIESVDAPNATVTINGQTVTVTYASLSPGENVTFSIFTTVLDGVEVDNTACVTADNQGAEECFTGSAMAELPTTGETPLLRQWILFAAGGLILLSAGMLLIGSRNKE